MMTPSSSSSSFYTAINIAKERAKVTKMRANLMGKISELGLRRKCKGRGTDYVLVLKIVDHSCPPPAGLTVNIFVAQMTGLPNVNSAGDIISLHNVEMTVHMGDVYCCFSKRVSSFALFNGKNNTDVNPYGKSSTYDAAPNEHQLLIQLRALQFHHHSQADTGLIESTMLRNIESDKIYDIICKIFHLCETSENNLMLFVWDGTDSPPVKIQTNLDLELEKPSLLYLEPLPLSTETLCSFPRVGTVLRIIVEEYFEDMHRLQSNECWVKLRGVSCQLQSGLWKGVVYSSKIFMLSDEDDTVKHRIRSYDERCASKRTCMPLTSFPEPSHITETDHKNLEYATLMESLTTPEVIHKCKCVVRVVASLPWKGEDLCSPLGNYRMRLTLEDPTARVNAFICEDVGVKFFGGHPTPIELSEKMHKLLGIDESGGEGVECTSRNPPWVWCCLLSYKVDQNDPRGNRRSYVICDTRLVG